MTLPVPSDIYLPCFENCFCQLHCMKIPSKNKWPLAHLDVCDKIHLKNLARYCTGNGIKKFTACCITADTVQQALSSEARGLHLIFVLLLASLNVWVIHLFSKNFNYAIHKRRVGYAVPVSNSEQMSTVSHQTKLLPGTSPFYSRVFRCFQSSFLLMYLASVQKMGPSAYTCHPHSRHRWSSVFPTAAWSSSGCCRHLRSK